MTLSIGVSYNKSMKVSYQAMVACADEALEKETQIERLNAEKAELCVLIDCLNERIAECEKQLKCVTEERDEWVIGDGALRVDSDREGLLAWLARGETEGVEADGPLPELPSW